MGRHGSGWPVLRWSRSSRGRPLLVAAHRLGHHQRVVAKKARAISGQLARHKARMLGNEADFSAPPAPLARCPPVLPISNGRWWSCRSRCRCPDWMRRIVGRARRAPQAQQQLAPARAWLRRACFFISRARYTSTVRGLISSRWPISLLVGPSISSAAISRSRGVRSTARLAPTTDPQNPDAGGVRRAAGSSARPETWHQNSSPLGCRRCASASRARRCTSPGGRGWRRCARRCARIRRASGRAPRSSGRPTARARR